MSTHVSTAPRRHDDENGVLKEKEMSGEPGLQSSQLTLTAHAVEKTRLLQQQPEYKQYSALRVYVSGKGCDGFHYGVQFDHRSKEDHAFPQSQSQSQSQSADGFAIDLVCDPQSFLFLQGSVIDYVDDDRGKGYVVDNPAHKKYRGKFYKRKDWQQRLQEVTPSSSS